MKIDTYVHVGFIHLTSLHNNLPNCKQIFFLFFLKDQFFQHFTEKYLITMWFMC
jgi:hypothetical protein